MEFTKDKAKETLNKWKSEIEYLNLQMNLGAAEARDEFEKVKGKVREWTSEMNDRINEFQDDSKESLNDLRTKLDELRVQAALGRAEAEDAFEQQKKDLKHKLNDVENESKRIYSSAEGKVKEVANDISDSVERFETRFDVLWVQFNLAKADAKDYWEDKRKDLSYKIQEMSGKVDRQMDNMEEKWDDFSSEMKEAWSHVKKAFRN